MVKYVRADPDDIRTWIVQWEIVPLIFAVGFAMMGLLDFWLGLLLLTAATAAYVYDLWNKKQKRAIFATAAIYILILTWAFRPTPLTVLIDLPQGNYSVDSIIRGIKWKSDYYPVNFVLINKSRNDYTDFKAYFRTDALITKVGIKPSINQCVAYIEAPEVKFALPQITKTGPSGELITTPLDEDDVPQTASTFQIRCDKIAAKSRVDLVLATVRLKPRCAASQVNYVAIGREHVSYYSQCFSPPCKDLPKEGLY